jgi:adenylosuccinate lyase
MPHKINPIDFENSEGNSGLAVALLGHMSVKLPQSRLQRDLSDSTVMRNLGVALGHWFLGVTSALAGLERVAPDEEAMALTLSGHHEVLAEAWQVALRAHGIPEAYERLKTATRDRPGDAAAMRAVLDDPAIPEDLRHRLAGMTPAGFVGRAPDLARRAVADVRARFSPR